MNDETDHSYFFCSLLKTTVKQYQIVLKSPPPSGDSIFWVPKSLCTLTDVAGSKFEKRLEVESWKARQEGME